MEIKVNIPQNDYIQPTEVRAAIVQKICDIFLDRRAGCYHNIFHPYSGGKFRDRTLGLVISDCGTAFKFSSHALLESETWVRFNGQEMKAAFAALIKAGYHMYRVHEYGSWMGYLCDKKPFYEGGQEVHSFNDFID